MPLALARRSARSKWPTLKPRRAPAVDSPRMRLFVGIPLSSEVRTKLATSLEPAIAKAGGWRWALPDTWHLTLLFLGNTSPERCDLVSARLRAIQSPGVSVQLEGFDFFERDGIFLAGVSVCPALSALHQKVSEAGAQSGFEAEMRPYHPHITLARAQGKVRSQTIRALRDTLPAHPEFPPFLAEEFLLFESFLGQAGARYEVRERFALTGI